ncbi:hypothetical protein E4U17_000769 [Claviceps sp. LM77 group G4]|nr:hypothetical protein E4U17_000769 [Claviceps sp. LM77 group G4]KAG6084153.1 hypothetical protein E4U33_003893 [Claviceps sp. LM78 group G4]KAG6084571.1 hypothetical protein E4U16_001468 [Claviceps sp. LM84 group G4]
MDPSSQPQETQPDVEVTHRRGPWSSYEDFLLMSRVRKAGARNWVGISDYIGTRSAKQCRERYHQSLNPSLNHAPITEEEGKIIIDWVAQSGAQWAQIARHLKGRSDNAVKNWYNGVKNRNKRRESALDVLHQKASQQDDAHQASSPVTNFARPLPSVGCPSLPRRSGRAHFQRRSSRLLSPCASDHGEYEDANYTTSPATQRSRSLGMRHSRASVVNLPPLRDEVKKHWQGQWLPGVDSFHGVGRFGPYRRVQPPPIRGYPTRGSPVRGSAQLLTAPNSPLAHASQSQTPRSLNQGPQSPEMKQKKCRKMELSQLLT